MYGMFLYGQYEDLTPTIIEREVERTVYVGGSHEASTKKTVFPTIRVRLLRKEEEKFNVLVKSIEEI
jgi:hypothetical protein